MQNTERLLEHLRFLARKFSVSDLELVMVALLMELGIPAKLIGYHFIKTAILLYSEHQIGMVNKGLYAEIASLHSGHYSLKHVEAAIRDAIRAGWENREDKMWVCFLPGVKDVLQKPPSNHEFIAELSRVLKLWKDICQSIEKQRQEERYGVR